MVSGKFVWGFHVWLKYVSTASVKYRDDTLEEMNVKKRAGYKMQSMVNSLCVLDVNIFWVMIFRGKRTSTVIKNSKLYLL